MGIWSAALLAGCGEDAEPNGSGAGGAGGSAGTISGAAGSSSGSAGTAGAGTGGVAGAGNGGTSGTNGGSLGAGTAGVAGSSGAGAGGTAGSAGSAGDAGSAGVSGAGGASGSAGTPGGGFGGIAGTGGVLDGAGGTAGTSAGTAGSAGNGGSGGEAPYTPCPATGACVIMPYGDSITEGYPIWGGYRMELFSLARAAGHEITFVGSVANGPNTVDGVPFPRNHEGHGGYTIDDVPSRNANGIMQFAAPSINNYHPHIVTLMIGTNDLNGNIEVGTAPQRLGELLDAIYAADEDILVILAQIVPTRTDGTNQTVRNYNAAFPDLVEERVEQGRHLVLIDMYEAFTRDADYKTALLGDNLHPNEAGYTRMAETWYEALEPYLR